MHVFLKGQILCRRQRHLRRCDTFDGRVVRQVYKQDCPVKGSRLAKALDEKVGLLKSNSHCREHNGKVLVFSQHLRLSCDLCRKLGMRQTGCGEDWQLLSADQGVQPVDGRHPGLNKFLRVTPRRRVHGKTVDVHSGLRQDLRSVVYGPSQPVKNASQHIFGHAQLHAPSKKPHLAVGQVDPGGALEKLYQNIASVYFEHLASSGLAAHQLDLSQFIIGHAFYAAHEHQRSRDFLYGSVLLWHISVPPFRKCWQSARSVPRPPFYILHPARLPSHI